MNKINKSLFIWLICITSIAGNQQVVAEGIADRIDTSLSFRSDVWNSSRQLDDIPGVSQISGWGQAKLNLNEAGTIVGSGWLLAQNPEVPDTSRGSLREFYWRYNYGDAEWKIGRQMVVWGRADGVNPTDNLSVRDFTLLSPEDGDQRFGNEAVQFNVNTGIGNLSSLWFPHAASNKIPLALLPNVHYQVVDPEQSQWAIKWDARGEGIDGSLSYFEGIDPMPDLLVSNLDSTGLTIAVRNHKVQILGADFSMSKGDVIWRGEASWMQTESTGQNDFVHKKPQLLIVGGGEWSFGESSSLGVQAIIQQVKDFQSPENINQPILQEVAWRQAATSNQTSEIQHGLTFRLASRWWNDTLMGETSAIMLRPSDSGIWRTKINFAINDHLNFLSGFDYYFGSERSFFGQLDKNRIVYIQLRYGI